MAYDRVLADRIRSLLVAEPRLTEQRMFGGLAFLVGGHLAVAASGGGGLLVRVEPADSPGLVAATAARPMEMRGRTMDGWLRVPPALVETDDELARWVTRGAAYAGSLPPKG